MFQTVKVKSEGMTVTKIVWQALRRKPEGYVERVYGANPGLAALGPELPVGTPVKLPLDDVKAEAKPAIRLWD